MIKQEHKLIFDLYKHYKSIDEISNDEIDLLYDKYGNIRNILKNLIQEFEPNSEVTEEYLDEKLRIYDISEVKENNEKVSEEIEINKFNEKKVKKSKNKIYSSLIVLLAIVTAIWFQINKKETNNTKLDSLKTEISEKTNNRDISSEVVSVKIFFSDRDMSDYEGYEDFKPKIEERDEFRKNNKYTFCYDSEEFNSLEISGIGKNFNLIVKEGSKVVFSKSNFEINNKYRFTTRDFNLDGGPKYSITLIQNGKILFTGEIDSQGCM